MMHGQQNVKCRVVAPIKLEFSASVGFIHKEFDMRIFRKSVDGIEVSLQSDKNNGYFT